MKIKAKSVMNGFFIETNRSDPKREDEALWAGLDFNKNLSVFSIATD